MATSKASEITLDCSDGTKLAAQSWRVEPRSKHCNKEELRILCLHGWMDNCASYFHLAPALIRHLDTAMAESEPSNTQKFQGVHVVGLDLPGHGLSSHKSSDAPPTVRAEYLFYIAEAIRQLKWWNPVRGDAKNNNSNNNSQPKFVLMGHSMSGGLVLMYAAAFPEQVKQLVLLDSLGNLSRPVDTTSQNLRQFVQARQLDGPLIQQPENRFYYPTKETILKVRIRSPAMFPGKQYISEQAAKELINRGVVEDGEGDKFSANRKLRFRHDPRLIWNSLQYFSPEQLKAIYKDIQCPTCVLLGEDGWPVENETKELAKEVLQPAVLLTLPGSHHLHMDPASADRVVEEIVQFLSKP